MAEPTGIEAVVIGASWGGLGAISIILGNMRRAVGVPIIFCQHQYPHGVSSLQKVLRSRTAMRVLDVEDKMPVENNCFYLTPPNYHTLIERDYRFSLSIDPPVMYCRPAIDVLFESAAEAYGRRLAGIVLTGANEDGSAGLLHVARCGGMPIVQQPATAEVSIMPEGALRRVPWAQVMDLTEIGEFLEHLSVT